MVVVSRDADQILHPETYAGRDIGFTISRSLLVRRRWRRQPLIPPLLVIPTPIQSA
jgi:hypothetical protein